MTNSNDTLKEIFLTIKMLMKKFSPPLVNKSSVPEIRTALSDQENSFELIGNVPVPYGSKKQIIEGMYFATVAIRKNSVVLYFFPAYMNVTVFKNMAPRIFKNLKGKTCFHFKKTEHLDKTELDKIFLKGIAFYKDKGWIK